MRFSLKVLLVAFTSVAVSFAGLIYANLPWASSFYTAAFVVVLTGVVGALVRPWPERGYWIGFALFAGGYFWLALVAEGSLRFAGFQRGATLEPKLATTHLLLWSERSLRAENSPRGAFGVNRGPTEYFLQVGHSIFTLLFALAGGKLGQWFARSGQEAPLS
jgi:hypothetical protein